MINFTKSEKKKLRRLSTIAHERELQSALKELENDFLDWRQEEIGSFELSDRIHSFHNGPSRELFKKYNGMDSDITVGWAIGKGIINENEVDDNLLKKLELIIERYKK